jgi:Domain of unknown function (DUF1929)
MLSPRLLSGALGATLLPLLLVAPAGAHGPSHFVVVKGRTVSERALHAAEVQALGSEHAAEHSLERRSLLRWARRPFAFRRQEVRRTRRASARFADATAAATGPAMGRWKTAGTLPEQAINAVMLPTGKMLFWGRAPRNPGGNTNDRANYSHAYLWDPAHPARTRDVTPRFDVTGDGVPDDVPIFCSGQSLLPSGEVFVAGGTLAYPGVSSDWKGASFAFTFNPWTNKWTRQPDMRHGRWYPGQVELPDGRIAVLAGEDESGSGAMNSELEVFKPAKRRGGVGSWTWYPAGTRSTGFYPHFFVLPSGRVMLVGPNGADSGWLYPNHLGGSGSAIGSAWIDLLDMATDHPTASAVLLPGGPKGSSNVAIAGGLAYATEGTKTSIVTAESTDADASWPHWASTNGPLSRPNAGALPALNVARSNFNIVLLPDGSIAAVGGAAGIAGDEGQNFMGSPPDQRLKQIELYRPGVDRRWKLGPAERKWRGYHSTALMLPDGRLLSAGDDYWAPDGTPDPYHSTDLVELYTPPYLLTRKGRARSRPAITRAPRELAWNKRFTVRTGRAKGTRAVLLAPSAVTHGNDMNQRHLELRIAHKAKGMLRLVAPPSRNVAPPGWYMLFVFDGHGTPSKARWVQLVK